MRSARLFQVRERSTQVIVEAGKQQVTLCSAQEVPERAGVVAVLGTLVAAGLVALGSGLFPLAPVENADPDPGIRFDRPVLLVGAAFLFVRALSGSFQLALEIADRGYVLSHGEIVLHDRAEVLQGDRELLISSYLGEQQVAVGDGAAGG